jgi:hypothetical protein
LSAAGCLDEREAFEAWVLTQPGGTEYAIRRRDIPGSGRLGHYVEPSVDFAWQAICALSASRQEGWQPIETAPENGTFLVFMPKERTRIQVAKWHPNVKTIGNSFAFDLSDPTHWHPLPSEPHQPQEAQGDRHGE